MKQGILYSSSIFNHLAVYSGNKTGRYNYE